MKIYIVYKEPFSIDEDGEHNYEHRRIHSVVINQQDAATICKEANAKADDQGDAGDDLAVYTWEEADLTEPRAASQREALSATSLLRRDINDTLYKAGVLAKEAAKLAEVVTRQANNLKIEVECAQRAAKIIYGAISASPATVKFSLEDGITLEREFPLGIGHRAYRPVPDGENVIPGDVLIPGKLQDPCEQPLFVKVGIRYGNLDVIYRSYPYGSTVQAVLDDADLLKVLTCGPWVKAKHYGIGLSSTEVLTDFMTIDLYNPPGIKGPTQLVEPNVTVTVTYHGGSETVVYPARSIVGDVIEDRDLLRNLGAPPIVYARIDGNGSVLNYNDPLYTGMMIELDEPPRSGRVVGKVIRG